MPHDLRRHPRRPLAIRQDDAVPAAPTGPGFTGVSVAANTNADATTLAINTAAAGAGDAANTGVDFSVSATATSTEAAPSPSPTPTETAPDDSDSISSPSPATASSGGSQISMGTVIGACLGALAGAVIIILIGLWLYKRGTKPRARRPSNARHMVDKERAWGKLPDDNDDKWDGKDAPPAAPAGGKYQQKGVVSVGPMEKLTMFKSSTPSMHISNNSGEQHEHDLGTTQVATFSSHPFAQYHPTLAKDLAEADGAALVAPRPFLARVDPVAPISWDGDTVGRDSFLSLSSNNPVSPGDMAIPTPKLTSSEPHHWESAVVMNFDSAEPEEPRGRSPANEDGADARPRKSVNNPFFGASARVSVHSTHSRSRSHSRSRTPSISGATIRGVVPDAITMPAPPASAYTREEKGKYRAATPPSPASSRAPSTIIAHGATNPFSDPGAGAEADPILPPPTISFHGAHSSQSSQDRALASLLAALGPEASAAEVQERLRVASMNPSLMSVSQYTETDGETATLHQSWPVPPAQ